MLHILKVENGVMVCIQQGMHAYHNNIIEFDVHDHDKSWIIYEASGLHFYHQEFIGY